MVRNSSRTDLRKTKDLGRGIQVKSQNSPNTSQSETKLPKFIARINEKSLPEGRLCCAVDVKKNQAPLVCDVYDLDAGIAGDTQSVLAFFKGFEDIFCSLYCHFIHV